jgi:GntR family transcriptional regulator, transcriptional repressor for pyruvate dehydrogenase complex
MAAPEESREVFAPVTSGRISNEITDRIRSAIWSQQLRPGDRLPVERELADRLGVSRVSVRDALRMLEVQGLIEVKVGAGGGGFVTAPKPEVVGTGMADMLFLGSVTPAEVAEARVTFELAMLDHVCERATDEDLVALEAICDRAQAALDHDRWDLMLSAEFHVRLAKATHNTALSLFAESFQGALLTSLREAGKANPRMGPRGLAEHRELIAAIRSRDLPLARSILSRHLKRSASAIAEHIEPVVKEPVTNSGVSE